ncbi:MAG: M23 family metallopeptidase [Ignavibacteria bacterium]|nr:M23 family metallopeptidase [Ignavibacteria bacterium]
MKLNKFKKIFIFNYDLILVPRNTSSNNKTYRFTSFKALLLILIVLIVSNLILIALISYTPLGRILPETPFSSNENYSQVIELKQKVLELSREVERVQKINERLNLIIEGKPIPIDPRDLDTNYQKEKMRRDSLRILQRNNFSNNIYQIFKYLLTTFISENYQGDDTQNQKEFIFFIKPTEGLITRGFNKDISHFGIDFGVPVGSVVRASASGIIVFADYTINDGYKIIISHSRGYFTIYKHLSQILKKEKDYVKQGDIIALSGNTGKLTTGPHLHFEIWKYQTPIDPQKILVDLK